MCQQGGATAYSWSTGDEVDAAPFVSGEELLLVAGIQVLNFSSLSLTSLTLLSYFSRSLFRFSRMSPVIFPLISQARNGARAVIAGSWEMLSVCPLRNPQAL